MWHMLSFNQKYYSSSPYKLFLTHFETAYFEFARHINITDKVQCALVSLQWMEHIAKQIEVLGSG